MTRLKIIIDLYVDKADIDVALSGDTPTPGIPADLAKAHARSLGMVARLVERLTENDLLDTVSDRIDFSLRSAIHRVEPIDDPRIPR